ncbi:TPA: plasmid recombination protein [Streptococcus agalactiae]|nr:plasmid recombination protein [Streptococcus agalactiae]
MSYVVARMAKYKSGQLTAIYNHNERIFKNHSNKEIDVEKSHLNYELTNRDQAQNYHKQIKEHINENRLSTRGVRKDAILCNEWIITSDKTFFDSLDEKQTREFFETAKDYFAEKYGDANIAYARVHLDESTPHMHLGIVPMKNGKLSSKALFGNKEKLVAIQDELPKYLNEHGFNLQRGEIGSKKKHLETAEFKEKQRLLDNADRKLADKHEELKAKEWDAVGDLKQYELEKQSLAESIEDIKDIELLQLDRIQKEDLVKQSFDGKLKMDKETYNRLFQTASKHASSNAELKRDLVKAQSQNNHLSRELLNHRKTADKNIKLSQENRKLKDKVKMLDEQVKILNKNLSVWKEKAKEFMPKQVYRETLSIINSLNPIGLAKTAIRQVKKMVDSNS